MQDRYAIDQLSRLRQDTRERVKSIREIEFEFQVPSGSIALSREVRALPGRAQ